MGRSDRTGGQPFGSSALDPGRQGRSTAGTRLKGGGDCKSDVLSLSVR